MQDYTADLGLADIKLLAVDMDLTLLADDGTMPENMAERIEALDRAGVSQSTQTAGSFSESMSYSNPDGDLYLTSAERKSLGKGVQTAFHIHMGGVA